MPVFWHNWYKGCAISAQADKHLRFSFTYFTYPCPLKIIMLQIWFVWLIYKMGILHSRWAELSRAMICCLQGHLGQNTAITLSQCQKDPHQPGLLRVDMGQPQILMQSEKGCSVNKEAEEMLLNTHITKRKLMLTDYTIMYKNRILHF